MAVQDLTPQLRTRLSRVERVVGWFVFFAAILLIAGFVYYLYETARRKGWFLTKIPYYTYLQDATGLRVGDGVRLMGFDVGHITEITAMPPEEWFIINNYNVFVQFQIWEPFYGYLWTDSQTIVATGDLLGKRVLEVTRGSTGVVTVIDAPDQPLMVMDDQEEFNYIPFTPDYKGYYLPAMESPALTVRLDHIADRVESALPGFFQLTNQLAQILSNSAAITANANELLADAQPLVHNLTSISALLTNGPGALGEWLIPTNLNYRLDETLATASMTLATTEHQIAVTAGNLNQSLENLAGITGSLHQQVQDNDQILAQISKAVIQAEELMQGLQRHWLFRSAFRDTDAPPALPRDPVEPPRSRRRW
jgi:ABC-type transporter Mla subunit MlaD